jgi:hypothetical protein
MQRVVVYRPVGRCEIWVRTLDDFMSFVGGRARFCYESLANRPLGYDDL